MVSRNDITGDALISKVNSDSFRDNFDRIFRKGKKDGQTVHEGVLESTSAQSDNEVHRTHESCDAVVEELDCTKCEQCGCFSECTKNHLCKRCVTK